MIGWKENKSVSNHDCKINMLSCYKITWQHVNKIMYTKTVGRYKVWGENTKKSLVQPVLSSFRADNQSVPDYWHSWYRQAQKVKVKLFLKNLISTLYNHTLPTNQYFYDILNWTIPSNQSENHFPIHNLSRSSTVGSPLRYRVVFRAENWPAWEWHVEWFYGHWTIFLGLWIYGRKGFVLAHFSSTCPGEVVPDCTFTGLVTQKCCHYLKICNKPWKTFVCL